MNKLNNKSKFDYCLSVRGTGGHFTIGSISREAADYWLANIEDLERHLISPEDRDYGPSEERCRIEDYRDSADLVNEIGFSEIDKVMLYSKDSDERLLQWHEEDLSIIQVPLEHQIKLATWSGSILSTTSSDWGHMIYEFSTETEFDYRKLRFTRVGLENMTIINQVIYDDEVLEFSEWFEYPANIEANVGTYYGN